MSDDISTSDVEAPPSSAPDTSAPPPSPAAPDSSAPSSSAPDTDSNAPSSGDSRQSDRDGLLAVIQKVVETKPEKPALPSDDAEADPRDQTSQDQAAATGTGDQAPPDATATQTDADPTEAELKKLRPETRKRFERLLSQRNEYRQNLEAVQPELAEHRQLRGYLTEHQLAAEDVNVLLGVGAALRRGDYKSFLDGVSPYIIAAQEALGLRISTDLQQQVNEGLIDENTARELTRVRHRAAQAEARLQDANRVTETTQQVQHVDQIRSAVDSWEASIRQRDPDYAQMSGAVRRYAQGLLQERGTPRTPQEAVALTQDAYDEAKEAFRKAQPAPRPTRNGPSSIHVATGTPTAQPRTMKEAVVMALANARRAS